MSDAFPYKHSLFRRRNARSSGDEEGSAVRNGRAYCYGKAVNRVAPDTSTKLRVRCDFFCTNATSGIIRRRRLMCESRVLPCPQGFAERQKGETREEGGHLKRCDCSHNVENLSVSISSILRRALPLWLTAFFSSRVPSAKTLPISKQ